MNAPHDTAPLRIAVFNDSRTMRAVIHSVLARHRDLEIVVEASDGTQAGKICREAQAQLVLMDVVMPNCNGYEATRAIMSEYPSPILMVSSVVNTQSADVLFEALKAGALLVTEAPPAGDSAEDRLRQAAFVQTIRNVAAGTRSQRAATPPAISRPVSGSPHVDVIGICASAGGPTAVTTVLSALPAARMPPILLVQHLARGFAQTFAQWLTTETRCTVEVAEDGMPLEAGKIYLAPDDHHLGYGAGGIARLSQDLPIGMFRPSATFLLRSLQSLGSRALGVVLSGMGSDGAAGAVAMRRTGAAVVAQDRESCAVYGMPEATIHAGGADEVLNPPQIAAWLVRKCGVNP